MTHAQDIVSRVRAIGGELTLKPNGMIHYERCSPEIVELLRAHKPEIVALLQAESVHRAEVLAGLHAAKAASEPDTAQTFTRLQLAEMALAALVPDIQEQQKIRGLAKNYAQGWKWSGSANYEHVLSGAILDQIESVIGRIICFTVNADNNFTSWYCKPMDPPPPPKSKPASGKPKPAQQKHFFGEQP